MQKHTKIYYEAFGYSPADYIPPEISGEPAVDINHIDARGSGGDPKGKKDRIENLMAVTRDEHNRYGDVRADKYFLFKRHAEFMEQNGVKFDHKYIEMKLYQYKPEKIVRTSILTREKLNHCPNCGSEYVGKYCICEYEK